MNKIIVLILIVLVSASVWHWKNKSLHQPISVNNVASIELWADTPEHISKKATLEETQKIVEWFNSSTNIRQNKDFAGITPYAGIIIELESGGTLVLLTQAKILRFSVMSA